MKLFLSSRSISKNQVSYFTDLVGKQMKDISLVLIENAADPYVDNQKRFVYETRAVFESLGLNITYLDLKLYHDKEKLYEYISKYDVVWFGGGNVFYLRWLMRESGFDKISKRLLTEGCVYGGGSAGAIVAGPTLAAFDVVDDPSLAPDIIYDGLSLTDKIIIPHWGMNVFQNKLEKIKRFYKSTEYTHYTLSDKEALIIQNNMVTIVS